MPISIQQLQQIAQVIYSEGMLRESKVLMGGISAQTILLEIVLADDEVQKVVLRQHGEVDRQRNPNIAHDEYQLLSRLHDMGFLVSKPIYVDISNTIVDVPYMVIDYIEHDNLTFDTLSSQQIRQVAEMLVKIHQIDLRQHDLSFLPDLFEYLQYRLNQTPSSEVKPIHDVLVKCLPNLKQNKAVLQHGDYWLGNVLWRGGKITAVIDWEDAMLGDPLTDLGLSRLEMLWAVGQEAMEIYTEAYFAQMPEMDRAGLPFWDLWGALRSSNFTSWFDDATIIQTMQTQYDGFVASAMRQLS